MATNTKNQRPDPAKEQQEALNRAVGASAIGKTAPALNRTSDASSLDTFNATPAPTKVESAVAGISRNREDDGLKHPGGGSSADNNMGGPRDLNADEAARAEEAARGHLDDVGNDHEDTDGEDDQSPFEFKNPAIEALKQDMYDSLRLDEEQSMGGGSAAGKHAPDSSGGGSGEVSSTGAQGGGGGGQSSDVGMGGGGGGTNDARDPFTGQGIGVNAYGGPGVPGLPNMDAGVGGFKPDAQMTALMGLAMEQANDRGSSSPSVADAALDQAYKEVYGQQAKDPDAGKTTDAAVVHKGEAGKPGSNAWYWDNEKGEVVEAKDVTDQAKADAAADMKTTATTDTSKIEGAEEKSGDTIFNFIANHMDAANDYEKEQTKKAAEAQKAREQKEAQQNKTDQPPPDSDMNHPPTPAEMAFRRYLYESTNYHGSPGHNEGVTNPDPTSEGIDRGGTVAIDHSRDVQESMVGQPVRDGSGASGRGPLTLGRRPGDLGNVDPGEGDDFGPNTSNPQTNDPGSALDGFGGSGLSIADAHRDDEEDDEDSDDDDSN